jgi:hypothetical protein
MTDSNTKEEPIPLSDKQLQAIAEILSGKTDTAVADSVGVSRQTLLNWRKDDPYFIAELNGRRKEIWEGFINGLRDLVNKATATMSKAIEAGDVKTALWFLEKFKLETILQGYVNIEAPAGPTDPEAIISQQARAVAEKAVGIKNKPWIPDLLEEDIYGQRFQNEDVIVREAEKIARLLKKNASKLKASLKLDEAA